MITKELLKNSVQFAAAEQRVQDRLERCKTSEHLARFLIQYASWNGVFANGVVALAGRIGAAKSTFIEPNVPWQLADRSNLVASYIFDAARDEFDDSIAVGRDPHRSLAQATILAAARILNQEALLHEHDPAWLVELNENVLDGYAGAFDDVLGLFEGIGYHLGSEVLADREFSIIDTYLRESYNDLVQALMRTTVNIGGEDHRAYAWIGIHSGHGGGVEDEHFEAALKGVNLALSYVPAHHTQAVEAIIRGFKEFERHHAFFFDQAA